jgi:hypothetical protein
MKDRRDTLNIRVNQEFREAIGELQRASPETSPPSAAEIIKSLVFAARDRLRKVQERRK